jgi:hypothetical protein
MQGGKRPSKKQQDFQNWMRGLCCAVCGNQPEIHHMYGSTAKHNKQSIGQWATIPLCSYHHTGPKGVHSMGKQRKDFEKREWAQLALGYDMGGHGEIPGEVVQAIKDFHL